MNYHRLIVLPALLITVTATAQTSVSPAEKIVEHHLASADSRNVEEIVRDYADDAILISPDGVNKGKQAIHTAFQQMMAQQPFPALTTTRKVFEGNVGYITWTMNAGQPNAVSGTDTFIIRNGKIVVQTVAILTPPAPAKP